MPTRTRRPIPPEERATILRMASEGKSYREIAETLGRPQGTINRAISDGILEGKLVRRYERLENRKG